MKDQNNTHPIKSYLLLYTGILFAVHLGVYAISLITGDNIYIFPLIFVQNEGILMIILNLPFILLCDFIITGTILSFIFYFKKDDWLPWIKGSNQPGKNKSGKISITVLTFVLIIYSYVYSKFGTIFVIFSVIKGNFISYSISGKALQLISILVLIMLAVFILSLIIKHFYNPVWFDLLIAVIQLIFLYFIVKVPIGEFIFSKGRIKSLIHSYDRIQAYNFTVDIISSIRLFFIIASIITTLIFIKKLINLFVDIIEKL